MRAVAALRSVSRQGHGWLAEPDAEQVELERQQAELALEQRVTFSAGAGAIAEGHGGVDEADHFAKIG